MHQVPSDSGRSLGRIDTGTFDSSRQKSKKKKTMILQQREIGGDFVVRCPIEPSKSAIPAAKGRLSPGEDLARIFRHISEYLRCFAEIKTHSLLPVWSWCAGSPAQ